MDVAERLNDLNAAERAFERVKPEMEALEPAEFTAMNLDVVSATSTVLGVVDRIVSYRDRLAALPEFDIQHVDRLTDYATAAWYVFVSNLHEPKPEQFEPLMQECVALRRKMLLWAEPLVANGNLDEAAIIKIKEGAGNKDVPSDVVALVALYRAAWDEVEDMCAVTEADLDRGGQIGPFVFAMVSQKEQRAPLSASENSRQVRAAWTLVDRAYSQCLRGLSYLLFNQEEELARVVPSLRRNASRRQRARSVEPIAPTMTAPSQLATDGLPSASTTPIGGGDGPFGAAGQ